MTQTADLLYKMAEFFRSEEFFEKGEDARLELSPDDVRCMNRIIKACGNAVSRQAVIDAINKEMNNDYLSTFSPYARCMDAVRKLPSVNPQDCHIYYHTGYQAIPSAYIEQAYIKGREMLEREIFTDNHVAIPSAEPKIGHWIPYKNEADVYKCTACGAIVYEYPTSWNYCPWCGAKMESEQNE